MPVPQDLFQAAEGNASTIDAEYRQVLDEHPRAAAITQAVAEISRVSVNRRYDALISLLEDGALPSGYYHAKALAKSMGMNVNGVESFAECLVMLWRKNTPKQYVRRRIAFLKAFERGDDHLFGALNAGGAGAAAQNGAYGEYCIVLKKEVFEKLPRVAYCKHDTLDHDEYWQCGAPVGCLGSSRNGACPAKKERHEEENLDDFCCEINSNRLVADYAPHSRRGHLVAIKHREDLDNPDWTVEEIIRPRKGKTEEYIEVCFILEVTVDHVEEVRFHPELVRCVFDELCIEDGDLERLPSVLSNHERVWNLLDQQRIPHGFVPEGGAINV